MTTPDDEKLSKLIEHMQRLQASFRKLAKEQIGADVRYGNSFAADVLSDLIRYAAELRAGGGVR